MGQAELNKYICLAVINRDYIKEEQEMGVEADGDLFFGSRQYWTEIRIKDA